MYVNLYVYKLFLATNSLYSRRQQLKTTSLLTLPPHELFCNFYKFFCELFVRNNYIFLQSTSFRSKFYIAMRFCFILSWLALFSFYYNFVLFDLKVFSVKFRSYIYFFFKYNYIYFLKLFFTNCKERAKLNYIYVIIYANH